MHHNLQNIDSFIGLFCKRDLWFNRAISSYCQICHMHHNLRSGNYKSCQKKLGHSSHAWFMSHLSNTELRRACYQCCLEFGILRLGSGLRGRWYTLMTHTHDTHSWHTLMTHTHDTPSWHPLWTFGCWIWYLWVRVWGWGLGLEVWGLDGLGFWGCLQDLGCSFHCVWFRIRL